MLGKRIGGHTSPSPSSFKFLLEDKNSPSLPMARALHLVHPPPLSLNPSLLFLAVKLRASVCHCYIKTVCYMRVNGYGGPTGRLG